MENTLTSHINNILIALTAKVSEEQLTYIKNALYIEFNNVELVHKTYELADVNDNVFYLKKFVQTKKIEGLCDNTLKVYYSTCNNFLVAINKCVTDIVKDDVLFYLANYQYTRKVSKVTLLNMLRYLSSFFTWLHDEDYIVKNPTKGIKSIKQDKKVKKPYTEEEMEKMRCGATNVRDRAIIEFLYSTGCRVSEAISVDISSIDFNKQRCIINGKGNKERYIYFTDACVFYLKKYILSRTDDNDALFMAKGGKRLQKSGMEYIVKKIGKKFGIDAYPHKFRRTFCCRAIEKGANIQDISKLMGHANIDTTMIYYTLNTNSLESAHKKFVC